jgi:hypothetical protein
MLRSTINSSVATFILGFGRFVVSLPDSAVRELSNPIRHEFYQNLYQYGLGVSSLTHVSHFNKVQGEVILATRPKRSRQPYTQQEYLLLQRDTPATLAKSGEQTIHVMISAFYKDYCSNLDNINGLQLWQACIQYNLMYQRHIMGDLAAYNITRIER